ncbi:ribonuclease P protein component [Nocardiopsis lambiniae]|uniref:Ribonuclease P protein component n=1 Tax=Nocardiopsis lambiniae TaxID=3075539 RepID=A0ABU2MAL8_9ACTN|nr:ribonuclease P protein component [Nocardiopsis sp. DSM 44743]MDT0329718.1 ribonuclease P protein component [Nocardiopsis sp. DSM 44743]
MLSPKNRMRHSAEFGSAMRSGRRASRDDLGVVYLPPPTVRGTTGEPEAFPEKTPDPPRVGFVVSKAVGGAVVRKRVQRRLRHLMRPRLSELPDGSLLVVRARPSAATARHEDLAAQLDGAISSAMRPKGASRRRRGRGSPRPQTPEPAKSETTGGRPAHEGGERWTDR